MFNYEEYKKKEAEFNKEMTEEELKKKVTDAALTTIGEIAVLAMKTMNAKGFDGEFLDEKDNSRYTISVRRV